ncbi:MAG: DUF4437 domain-containing protein, partial [Algicola sp.]|nr:DUF4437 domain-containing protein [Algicola sp.]
LHSVVIEGVLNYTLPEKQETKVLDTGSYFGATSKAIHTISNNSEDDTVIYVRTNGNIRIE